MSMISEIGTLLEANGFGTVTVDLFEGSLPDAPQNCIALFERMGRTPVLAYANTVVAERPLLQVQVRDADYETAYTKLKNIRALLQNYSGTVSGTRYLTIQARGAIASTGVDENLGYVLQLSFNVMKEPS